MNCTYPFRGWLDALYKDSKHDMHGTRTFNEKSFLALFLSLIEDGVFCSGLRSSRNNDR